MILDTSAVLAIMFEEPEGDKFLQVVYSARPRRISAASFVELSMVVEGQLGSDAGRQTEMFLRRAEIEIEAVSVEQAYLARQAFLDFGKGRHPAKLNFGDCFAYALAKATGEALLFKGTDFSQTDVRVACL
jgi:ribonuclease VapC